MSEFVDSLRTKVTKLSTLSTGRLYAPHPQEIGYPCLSRSPWLHRELNPRPCIAVRQPTTPSRTPVLRYISTQ